MAKFVSNDTQNVNVVSFESGQTALLKRGEQVKLDSNAQVIVTAATSDTAVGTVYRDQEAGRPVDVCVGVEGNIEIGVAGNQVTKGSDLQYDSTSGKHGRLENRTSTNKIMGKALADSSDGREFPFTRIQL